MANLLAEGIAWLDEIRTTSMSETVTYRRSGQSDRILLATKSRVSYEVVDESGRELWASAVDFLITTSLLVGLGTPQIGDLILTDGGTKTFEVLDLEGLGHYRWSDPSGTILRIHAKLVS